MANAMLSPTITPRPGVAERVLLTFRQSSHSALRDLATADFDGTIVVSGRVPTFYMKQLAQVVAQNVDGVRKVENRTVVSK
jgi:osmotically-inducible protein OsmY